MNCCYNIHNYLSITIKTTFALYDISTATIYILKISYRKNMSFWSLRDLCGAKAAPRTLMKLTTGINFINILFTAFAPVDFH